LHGWNIQRKREKTRKLQAHYNGLRFIEKQGAIEMPDITEETEMKTVNNTNGKGWELNFHVCIAPSIYEENNSYEATTPIAQKLRSELKNIIDKTIKENKKRNYDFMPYFTENIKEERTFRKYKQR
jgi:hypothetical protein